MSLYRRLAAVAPLTVIFLIPIEINAQSADRSKLEKEIEALRNEMKQKEAQILVPSEQDRATYAEFLGQRDTGMCRLMPREDFDGKLLIRGGGSYYSFTKPSSEYGNDSQIGLERGQFHIGLVGGDFGYIVDLSEVELDTATLETAPVKTLVSFAAPNVEADARIEQAKSYQGFKLQDYVYKRTAAASPGHTYVLRVVQYDRSDTIVAFRALRRDDDGSIVLIWKILAKLPTPQLVRTEVR